MFKHIVVGCNGGPESRDAVALGAAIASVTDATLSLVGVFRPALLPTTGVSDRKTLRAQAAHWLARERDLLAPHAHVHTVVSGSVPRALRHYAERWHADLVIVGSDPSAAPGHVAISRRARQLLYEAPFSVGLAARGIHEQTPALRVVGVGYDGGPEAEVALNVATGLARSAHARLAVRRVVEDRVPDLTSEEWMTTEDWSHAHMWGEAVQAAQAETEAATSQLGIPVDVSSTLGDPGYELRALSDTLDLLVVGSRRWGPIARLVSGGVGETLVQDASCSVLIVPRPMGREARAGQARQAGSAVG